MAGKKPAKSGNKAKAKAKHGGQLSPKQELEGRHMRLTQEFDRLATMVARQGQLLQGVYLVLQQAKLMPYAPEVSTPLPAQKAYTGLEPGKSIKTGFSKSLEQKPEAPKFSKPAIQSEKKTNSMAGAMFPGGKVMGAYYSYDVVLRRNGQTLGYLTSEGTWTLDPKQIKMWTLHEDAQGMLSKAPVPEGAKAEIRGHN